MVADNLSVSRGTPVDAEITVPGDKSISHRALIISALATGTTRINNLLHSDDVYATRHALGQLGVPVSPETAGKSGVAVTVDGVGLHGLQSSSDAINCGNSGTTMRLLAGALAGQEFSSRLVGDVSLGRRPMQRLAIPLNLMGAKIELSETGTAPIEIAGNQQLRAIDYDLPIPSAQVKSALLLAGLYAAGATRITEPDVCRDHTELMLKSFGVKIDRDDRSTSILAPKLLSSPGTIDIPGDLSSAAFFLVRAAIRKTRVHLRAVGNNPTRNGILGLLLRMGARIEIGNARVTGGGEAICDITLEADSLQGIDVSATEVVQAIDDIPVLLVAAACAHGTTTIKGASELRHKESDRIAAMAGGLTALGIRVEEFEDGMSIEGGQLQGGIIDSHDDHRVAMAFAIAGTVAEGPVTIRRCRNIATSYPGFVDDLRKAGAHVEEIQE